LATGQSIGQPINTRLSEAADRIREATGGRLEIKVFPANQLGSDTDLISQTRNGAVEILNIAGSVLSTLVPAAALANVGFAFSNYDQVWRAMVVSWAPIFRVKSQRREYFRCRSQPTTASARLHLPASQSSPPTT
jgi:TRAP-type C4-dicarboxylate transport system substrate-binding protein